MLLLFLLEMKWKCVSFLIENEHSLIVCMTEQKEWKSFFFFRLYCFRAILLSFNFFFYLQITPVPYPVNWIRKVFVLFYNAMFYMMRNECWTFSAFGLLSQEFSNIIIYQRIFIEKKNYIFFCQVFRQMLCTICYLLCALTSHHTIIN